MSTTWYVYKWTRPTYWRQRGILELLGTVEAEHQPAASRKAAERWPEWAKAVYPHYRNGRLVFRTEKQ